MICAALCGATGTVTEEPDVSGYVDYVKCLKNKKTEKKERDKERFSQFQHSECICLLSNWSGTRPQCAVMPTENILRIPQYLNISF